MEWKTPRVGDRKTKVRFAWLPLDCADGKTRWLERVLKTYYTCSVVRYCWILLKVEGIPLNTKSPE